MPQTGECTVPGSAHLCTPGGGRAAKTCAAEWFIDNPHNARGVISSIQSCVQGDPSCDYDTNPTTCTFHVAVCLRVPDPRLIPSCTPTDIAQFTLLRPGRPTAPGFGALQGALAALPGASLSGRFKQIIGFSPPISALSCTREIDIVVPMGRRQTLIGQALTVNRVRDTNALVLWCRKS